MVDEDMVSLRCLTLCAALQLGCAAAGPSAKPAPVSEVSLDRPPSVASVAPEEPTLPPTPDEERPPIEASRPPDADPSQGFDEPVDGWAVSQGQGVYQAVQGGVATGSAPPPALVGTRPRPRGKFRCNYPEDRRDGVSAGRVVLRVTVDAAGKPIDVKIVSDSGGFGETARVCALTALFHPGTDAAGAPEVSSATLVVRFEQL